MKQKPTYTIGIDEVGRGPLAGPVGVGIACVPTGFDWAQLPGVTDSKLLSETKREAIFATAKELQQAGQLRYEVAMVSAKVVDQVGIVSAINRAMSRALNRLEKSRQNRPFEWTILPTNCLVKLDGGLHASARYERQETIIKGDSKVPEIGLASIVAKVTRDRYMRRLAQRAAYAPYDFATHKGYGTKAHRAAIAQYGLSDQHRESYCKNIKFVVQ